MTNITYHKSADGKYLELEGLSKKQELTVKIPNMFWNLFVVDDFVFGMPELSGHGSFLPRCNHLLAYLGKECFVQLPVLKEPYYIAKDAFGSAQNIKSIVIPSCVEGIADEAFGCKSIVEVIDESHLNIAKAVEENPSACGGIVGAQACTGKCYTIHNGESQLLERKGVFYLKDSEGRLICVGHNGKKNSVKIAAGTYAIADYAFAKQTNLKKVSFPKTLTVIRQYAFAGCKALTAIKIPDSVKEIEREAFSNTGLRSFTVGKGVQTVATSVFMSCDSLETVVVPATVTKIEIGPFLWCDALKSIKVVNPKNWSVRGKGLNLWIDVTDPVKNVQLLKQYANCDFIRE